MVIDLYRLPCLPATIAHACCCAVDGDDVLTESEWVSGYAKSLDFNQITRKLSDFHELDVNQDGRLDFNEISAKLSDSGMDDAQINQLLFDLDGN